MIIYKCAFKKSHCDVVFPSFFSPALLLFFLCVFSFYARAHSGNLQDTWIVLPDSVQPYTAPALDAAKSEVILNYLEQIREMEQAENSQPDWICFDHLGQTLYLPQALLVKNVNLTPPLSHMNVDKYHPLSPRYHPDDLVELDQKWNFHASDYPKLLRFEAAEALSLMLQDAERMGIQLRVYSAYRSFEKQRTLYLNAIEKQGVKQEWVAKPGHSEHQLGTTVDLSNPDPRSVGHMSFGESKEGQWLQSHAGRYGFKQSYTAENARFTGYQSEPWHYRYAGR